MKMNTGLFVDLRCTGSSSSGGSAPYACDACHSLTANFVMTLSGDLKERVIPRAVCPCERPRSHSGYCSGLLTTLSNIRASNQSLIVVLRATLCAERRFIFPPRGYKYPTIHLSGRTSVQTGRRLWGPDFIGNINQLDTHLTRRAPSSWEANGRDEDV